MNGCVSLRATRRFTSGLHDDQQSDRGRPHARPTVVARLLEVDRQGIQRFNDADRQLLLTEYAASVARDAAAMETAFRRTLEKAP